jgi:hypothetical protein
MAKAGPVAPIQLPKGAIARVNLGQSFAEYDKVLERTNVYVETPAIRAALDTSRAKCFFVGRRGTGKTAITFYLERSAPKYTVLLLPQLMTPIEKFYSPAEMQDIHQRPFKSLVSSFKRAILDEAISEWIKRGSFSYASLDYSLILLAKEERML